MPARRSSSTGDVLAVDIGGSGVRASRFRASACAHGALVERPLGREMRAAALRAELAAALRAAAAGTTGLPVGFSVPAFLDESGKIRDALNLPGLDGLDLRALARETVGATSVRLLPDGAAAALAEGSHGAGRGFCRVLTVVVGTGCNAGMTVDGRVVTLAGGSLGDAGHGPATLRDVPCWCGGRGCLEALLSGIAFDRRAAALGLGDRRGLLDDAAHADGPARACVREAGVALGAALAAWSALLWPDRVVVGGGVGLACGDHLLQPARSQLRRTGADHLVSVIEVVPSSLGPGAPLVGAALGARDAAA